MRGSVYKRGKANYWIKVELGTDENGKRIRHQQRGGPTKKEAERLLSEILHRVGEGSYVPPSKQTVGAFLRDEWLPAIKSTVRPSTFEGYSMLVNKHIAPRLGGMKLQALTPTKLNALYADLSENGRSDGKGALSPKSVRNVHAVLRRALGDAVRWNLLPRNVAQFADPPKVRQSGDAEMATWDANELRTFLAFASDADERLYPAFHLKGSTGMRRGEVLGVRWTDIDLDKGTLAVRQTLLVSLDHQLVFGTPKTARSRRQIALDKQTVAVLRDHRKRQLEERIAVGGGYHDEYGLVFCKVDGSPLRPDSFSQSFDRLVARSGLPRIRLHDLRHTHATLALKAGVPVKVVSERLGHASTSFTMDTYMHVLPGMAEDAAEKVAGLLLGT